MRVVIDTNVIISGVLKTGRKPHELLKSAIQGKFTLLSSHHLQSELNRVLHYQKIESELKLTWSNEGLRIFLSELQHVVELIEHPEPRTQWVPNDPDDNWVIACALAGKADYIVSGDQYLLALGSAESIRIVPPAEFLHVLEKN